MKVSKEIMTDEEIIKGLQVCSSNGDCNECPINPHKGNYGFCTSLAIKAALDLISRLKAEVERLTLSEREAYNQLEKGNARMNAIIDAEIKEFAEKVKKELCGDGYLEIEDDIFCKTIDELVIEASKGGEGAMKEKQIEEMATDLYDNRPYKDLWLEDAEDIAKVLYEAGYRKQKRGEWEKRTSIFFDSEKVCFRCPECNTTWDTPTKFCPNCGAKMTKGE